MSRVRRSGGKRSDPVGKLQRRVKWLENKNDRLEEQNERLREQNRALKLQLEDYRQQLFKKNRGKDGDGEDKPPRRRKKRGAPKGHPGTTRKRPDRVDEHVDVRLKQCPGCGGEDLRPCRRFEDHYQEDIVIPGAKVTRFRHHFYWCRDCKGVVHGVGKGELPGSYIGPTAKSVASFGEGQLHFPSDDN